MKPQHVLLVKFVNGNESCFKFLVLPYQFKIKIDIKKDEFQKLGEIQLDTRKPVGFGNVRLWWIYNTNLKTIYQWFKVITR